MSSYNHIPINFQQAKLIEKDNAHYYETPSGEIFPSITTILQKTMSIEKKESLAKLERQRSGSRVHH